MSLASVTEELRKKIGPGGELGKSLKFVFSSDEVIRIDDTIQPPVVDNDNRETDCTILISMNDFKDIAQGKKTAQGAFMMGKIRIEGDYSVALKIGTFM